MHTKGRNQMSDTWFAVEDNNGKKIFSMDEVKVTFKKDPQVGRVWTMSYAQLADLQVAIKAHLAMNEPAYRRPDRKFDTGNRRS